MIALTLSSYASLLLLQKIKKAIDREKAEWYYVVNNSFLCGVTQEQFPG